MTRRNLFPLALLAILLIACDKETVPPPDDTITNSYSDEEEWEWKSAPGITLSIDTAWTHDTTIYF